MKRGILIGYTKGDDGLYRRIQTFPEGREIIVRDERAKLVRVERVVAGMCADTDPKRVVLNTNWTAYGKEFHQ